ncbi:hypothetical protein PLICRDRAFT_92914 [Plicaturopsis crispa FD-325 SS-3]|nr:hypothetical protein PLICRDRAFT_92914 [Plicaturopsis crispa FD-325 SS-3]
MAAPVTTTVFVQAPPVATAAEPKTVTVTVAPPLPTMTIGAPWTTPTPYRYTRSDRIIESYPYQPQHCFINNRRATGGQIAGAFFGGLGAGVLIVLVVLVALKLRRNRRTGWVRLTQGDDAHGSEGGYATPRGSGGDDVKEPLLRRGGEEGATTPVQA